MKRYVLALSFALVTFAFNTFAGETGIASGQPSGTNHPMVENIIGACSTPQNTFKNRVTNGSLENIQMVFDDRSTQYGIAQEDALVYKASSDKKMMDQIQMVFPFFSTEIHLIVRDNSPIRTLSDLAGKRVIEGPDGSGTWVTSQVVRSLTQLNWFGSLQGQEAGMADLMQGKADAMFINAGKPVGIIAKTPGIRLVSLAHPALDSFKYYTKTMITRADYGFISNPITTYKVKNGMITYAYKNQYRAEITALVSCIIAKMPEFQKSGHPKWWSVDPFDLESIHWPMHPVALSVINSKKASK